MEICKETSHSSTDLLIRGEAELRITCDTTKIALQASRQERKATKSQKIGEKTLKHHNLENFKMLPEMMFYLRKTRPETHSKAFKEISKKKLSKKMVVMKNFELSIPFWDL